MIDFKLIDIVGVLQVVYDDFMIHLSDALVLEEIIDLHEVQSHLLA